MTDYRDNDGVLWRRTGECNRCGDCCNTGDPFSGGPGPCALLKLLGDGLLGCSDREHPYYLNGCNIWPTIPQHITDKPNCSYTFEKVEEDGVE